MTDHFNGLEPDQAERLAMLAEECAEIVQAVTKILRHGYDSHHPCRPGQTNRGDLASEIEDLLCIVQEMRALGDIDPARPSIEALVDRWERKERWTHHQGVAR